MKRQLLTLLALLESLTAELQASRLARTAR